MADTDIASLPLFSSDNNHAIGAAQSVECGSRTSPQDIHRCDVVRIDVYGTVTHAADGCRLAPVGRAVIHDHTRDDKQGRTLEGRIERVDATYLYFRPFAGCAARITDLNTGRLAL